MLQPNASPPNAPSAPPSAAPPPPVLTTHGPASSRTQSPKPRQLLTKALTTAAISAAGNVFCQLVVEGAPRLDRRRLAVFTALGFAWVAPALHYWFGLVNRLVPAAGSKGALMRMALDQFAWAPVFIASIISLLSAVDSGGDLAKVQSALRSDWRSSITANWQLWVPAQFVNFRFVAPQHQLLFANVTSLAWNVWFSFLTRPKGEVAAAAAGGKKKK